MTMDVLDVRTPGPAAEDEDFSPQDELLDEADEFEEELAAEMLRTGEIEVWR